MHSTIILHRTNYAAPPLSYTGPTMHSTIILHRTNYAAPPLSYTGPTMHSTIILHRTNNAQHQYLTQDQLCTAPISYTGPTMRSTNILHRTNYAQHHLAAPPRRNQPLQGLVRSNHYLQINQCNNPRNHLAQHLVNGPVFSLLPNLI